MRTLVARQTPEDTSSEKPSSLRCILRPLAEYGTAVILCLLILVWAMKLWEADLATPFGYWHDGLMVQAYIKTGIDNPWYWQNHYQGMPATLQSADYPAEISASFLFLLIKLLSVALPQSALVMNLFYLASFPLVTLSALFVLRSLRLSYAPALVMSLLYTFIPYHFYQGEIHLFLAAYFTVPFMVMLILWSFLDPPLFFTWEPVRQRLTWSVRGFRPFASLALCILIGCSQIYYAFFTCFFLLVAAVSSAFSRKSLYPLCSNLLLVATITGVGVANLAPSIMLPLEARPKPGRSASTGRLGGVRLEDRATPYARQRAPPAPLEEDKRSLRARCSPDQREQLLISWVRGRHRFLTAGGATLLQKVGALASQADGQIEHVEYRCDPARYHWRHWFAGGIHGEPMDTCLQPPQYLHRLLCSLAVGLLLDKVRRRYAKSGETSALLTTDALPCC